MGVAEIAVLIVEDNPNDAELTLRALRGLVGREQVVLVEDGVKALEILAGIEAPGRLPRIVLLDLKLPKLDGLELLRRLKGDPRTQPMPVVVLTSSHEEHDLRESYRLGANSYLVKPVGFQEYVALVAQAGRYWLELNRLPPVR
ncbi:MAG: response regulator [Burkholderiales bacterium]|nr:response regulator [Burkholderiales bacterium]